MKEFIRKIISSDSPESSKRLFSLWGMVLVTIIVGYALIKGEAHESIITIFYVLTGLVLTLAGVASTQEVFKMISDNKAKKKEGS